MKIRKEIERYMTGMESTADGLLTARFLFPEDFMGFQGHFPAQKILPGVCQIQCIILMFELFIKKPVTLKEIVNAKFISPVMPSEEITCICSKSPEDGNEVILKASINKDGSKISELKLMVCIEK